MIEFKRVIESSRYLSPFENFEPYEGKVEIRWDPLTDFTTRIVHFPPRKFERFDVTPVVSSSIAAKCPFCDENVNAMTARLDKTMFGEEHLIRGDVRIIPNLLTFGKYSLVAIITKEHFVDIKTLGESRSIIHGIKALLDVFRVAGEKDDRIRYFSINCNYMPMSGGSLVHPHIQGMAGVYPTNYHRLMLDKSRDFSNDKRAVFWKILMEEEGRLAERFVGKVGETFWYVPFAPKGNIDVGCIFSKVSLFSIDDKEWSDFGDGLSRVLAYLDGENVAGFNLSIFSGINGEGHFISNARIVARRFLPPVNASDVSYFEKIHMETICLVTPEKVAGELREIW